MYTSFLFPRYVCAVLADFLVRFQAPGVLSSVEMTTHAASYLTLAGSARVKISSSSFVPPTSSFPDLHPRSGIPSPPRLIPVAQQLVSTAHTATDIHIHSISSHTQAKRSSNMLNSRYLIWRVRSRLLVRSFLVYGECGAGEMP